MRLVRWDMFSFILRLRKGKKDIGTAATVIEQDAAAVQSPAADNTPVTTADDCMRDAIALPEQENRHDSGNRNHP